MSSRPGEFGLIEKYLAPLAADPGAFGLQDDAAVLRPPPDCDLVVTTDLLAAGVHFFADDPPEAIAAKALRVNLSDLAAKGAIPESYLLSLALPESWDETWMAAFVGGLAADQNRYGIGLLGGDTSRSAGGLTISVTAIGRVPVGGMVKRGGARAGDLVYVTGTIGDAALGLQLRLGTLKPDLGPDHRDALRDRYLYPQPRTGLAAVLQHRATGAMDVSDGLLGDFGHICAVSGLGGTLRADLLPLSDAAQSILHQDRSVLPIIVNGGDDYEILATVAPDEARTFEAGAERAGVRVTEIGTMGGTAGPPVVVDASGTIIDIDAASHQHF